jgi:serine/threonine protein kinase
VTGRTISHYEILEKLGAGGMGEIYKARDPRLNRTVAVKVLPGSATGDPERRRRFLQEAQAASGLNHPNIITIHDIVTDDGSDYMVMEFIAGKTLSEVIPPGGLDMSKTLQYATQIADALGAAHAAGIVHRDLKPGNVMVMPSGRLKILDFGLAKITTETALTEATQTIASGPVTVEGSILGTVSYMSPEQAQGKRVDQRSDIFAFGALLYEMVTGHKAFAGDSALTTLTAILRDEVRPVSDFASGVPPELEEVIGRALRKDPAQRWQNMQEIYGVLTALRQRYESGILDPTQILPPRKEKSPLLPAAAVAAITVLGLSGWWVAARRGAAPKPQALPPQQAQVQPPAPAPGPAVETPTPTEQPKADDKPATPAVTTPSPAIAKNAAAPKKDDGTLTNDSVYAMLAAKVAEPVIVNHIRAVPKTKFDLSTQELIRLTRAGASTAVLEAMRNPAQSVPVAEAPSRILAPAPSPVTEASPSKLVVPPPTETKVFTLSNGLPVIIQLAADVPADPDPGTPLKFTLKGAFNVNGTTVLAAGAPVIGEVAGVKKGLLGLGAKPTYRLISVDAVDGSKIGLRAVPAKSDKMERVLESSGKHDKSLTATAGTEYVGYIDGPQTVTIRK